MTSLAQTFQAFLARDPVDVAGAALLIARLEYPALDPRPSLAALDALGSRALDAIGGSSRRAPRACIERLNTFLFEDEGFAGNRAHYDDFRNSLLNVVLARRLGIPITLGLVYIEVARRIGLEVHGVAFPGHFLLSVPAGDRTLILDPFDAGRELDESGCRRLLATAMGDDDGFHDDLLRPCSSRQLVLRMLNNLKRTYIELQSFPQAYSAVDMVLAADPSLLSELRDRGLLAYQLDDFPSALRDLEAYLRLTTPADDDGQEDEDADERREILGHVETLRRRVAALN